MLKKRVKMQSNAGHRRSLHSSWRRPGRLLVHAAATCAGAAAVVSTAPPPAKALWYDLSIDPIIFDACLGKTSGGSDICSTYPAPVSGTLTLLFNVLGGNPQTSFDIMDSSQFFGSFSGVSGGLAKDPNANGALGTFPFSRVSYPISSNGVINGLWIHGPSTNNNLPANDPKLIVYNNPYILLPLPSGYAFDGSAPPDSGLGSKSNPISITSDISGPGVLCYGSSNANGGNENCGNSQGSILYSQVPAPFSLAALLPLGSLMRLRRRYRRGTLGSS